MKARSKTLILFLLAPMALIASVIDPGKYSKQKSIKKAYIVNSDAGIDITNSYGNVFVTTWDENKVELDILIKVSGNNEDWVNKKIEDINVDIEALKNMVTAKTVFSSGAGKGSGKNNSFEINYTIKIPKNGGVKTNNKYGDVISTDLFSSVDIKCKYGKITLGKLFGNKTVLDIEYCSKSTVEELKNATINADYSSLSINEFGKIDLNANYTDINFHNGNEIKYDCNYGNLNFGKINTINGDGDYLTLKVDEIRNNMSVNTKYSKITVANIGAKANNMTIGVAYTNVHMNFHQGYSFDFNVELKYAGFKWDDGMEITSKQESNFSKSYQGFYKKSGINKISINSEYGNISLNRNN